MCQSAVYSAKKVNELQKSPKHDVKSMTFFIYHIVRNQSPLNGLYHPVLNQTEDHWFHLLHPNLR